MKSDRGFMIGLALSIAIFAALSAIITHPATVPLKPGVSTTKR